MTLEASPAGSTPGTPEVNPVATPGLTPLVPVNDPIAQMPIGAAVSIGVSVTAQTRYVAAAQGMGGVLGGSVLGVVRENGGNAGDQIGYALGGPAAGSFSLTPSAGGALLAVGPGGLAGSAGGTLYALTVTATDQSRVGPSVREHAGQRGGDR